jgi:two-component system, OmpR family, phosphate regulon sensor histidine kinase PhoR
MKNLTPHKLSIITAFLITLGFSLTYVLTSIIVYGELLWRALLLANLVLFLLSYGLFRYFVKKFIYERIQLIYKFIHSQKYSQSPQKDQQGQRDMINQANQAVMEWARDKRKEIEELRKLAEYRREFLGNISHELKTPIFNIQGYILTLLDGGLDDPEINHQYLVRTEKSVNRMISIIEDLESIARYESGEMKLKLTHFDIISLTRDVIEFLEIKAQNRNIRLLLDWKSENPVYVYADRQRIQQVLTNLVVNSIKYGTDNGRTKISFFDMDENILIEVTDSGIGIPQDDLPRIFERFFRADKSRSRQNQVEGGSGLGLAIVKHIIEAHNQTINVRSTPGLGSTFAFTLKKGKISAAIKFISR